MEQRGDDINSKAECQEVGGSWVNNVIEKEGYLDDIIIVNIFHNTCKYWST